MPGTVHLDVLKNCRIASPCSARWEDMAGDDKRRHCCHCDLNVQNLAAVRAYARRAYARVALLVAALMGACVAMTPNDDPWYGERRLVLYQPFEWIAQTLAPGGAWNARWGGMTMGMICPPSAGALPPTVHAFDERAPDTPVESDACDEPESPSESNSPAPRAKPQEDGAKIE